MDKKVFILNGCATAGKNTFVKVIRETDIECIHYSYVDFTRNMFDFVGIDIDNKTDKLRKLLADVNNALEEFDDVPFKDCKRIFLDFMRGNSEGDILFIDCREPEKIERMKALFLCKTIFVNSKITNVPNNCADLKTLDNYNYDYRIDNTGDFNDLRNEVTKFLTKEGFIYSREY